MSLSIIVPIYNVAPYLKKCVESLIVQDYDDYEIILVDDGSIDNSGLIADDLQSQYPERLIVVHQSNCGLSVARNTGLVKANGDYVCFVDSDDYWEHNVLGDLMNQIRSGDLDVLRFNYRNVDESYHEVSINKDPKSHVDYSSVVCDGSTFLNHRQGPACYAVMFIVRRSILKGCLFTPDIYFEDVDWTPRMLLCAKRVASTDRIVYNYLVRQGSITKAVDSNKKRKVLDDKLLLVNTLKQLREKEMALGRDIIWFDGMISETVVSMIGMLSSDFYTQRRQYLLAIKHLSVFPLSTAMATRYAKRKICLLNISPSLLVWLLHISDVRHRRYVNQPIH